MKPKTLKGGRRQVQSPKMMGDDASTSSTSNLVISSSKTIEDRLSELPEFILIQILSLMPTHDAMRTCILSKRWRYLSTFLYNFNFFFRDDNAPENFVSFVDHVFAHSVSSKIRKLQISGGNLNQYNSRFSQWLTFSVQKNVEHVYLWSSLDYAFTFPESFRTCSSLIHLDCMHCPSAIQGVIQWKSLNNLRLVNLVISDDNMVNLLSGCPALETMELAFFRGFRRLVINSSILKTLTLGSYKGAYCENDCSVEIIAPNLQHLEISGALYDLKCRLLDVSSVVNAKLTYRIDSIECIKDIFLGDHDEDSCHEYRQVFSTLVLDYLQKLTCATELTIGTWFTKVLCMLQLKGVSIPELECRYLKLELHMKKFNLYGVAGLLRASPLMETLNLEMETMPFDSRLCHFERGNFEGDTIDLPHWISSFVLPNLKKVKIIISYNMLLWMRNKNLCLKDDFKWGSDKLFKLSEYLLKAATILEKFVIISKKMEYRTCKTCSTNCLSLYLSRLAEELLGCTRSSTNSLIIFQE